MGLGVLSLGETQIDAIAAKAVTNVQSAGVALEDHAGDVVHAQVAAAIAEAASQMEAPLLARIDAGIEIGKQVAASIDAITGIITKLTGFDIGGLPVNLMFKN